MSQEDRIAKMLEHRERVRKMTPEEREAHLQQHIRDLAHQLAGSSSATEDVIYEELRAVVERWRTSD